MRFAKSMLFTRFKPAAFFVCVIQKTYPELGRDRLRVAVEIARVHSRADCLVAFQQRFAVADDIEKKIRVRVNVGLTVNAVMPHRRGENVFVLAAKTGHVDFVVISVMRIIGALRKPDQFAVDISGIIAVAGNSEKNFLPPFSLSRHGENAFEINVRVDGVNVAEPYFRSL